MQLRRVDPDEPGWPERWHDAYHRSFGQPPWNEPELGPEDFLAQLRPHRSWSTWVAAEAVVDGAVVGGVCGWRAPVAGLELTDTQRTLRELRGEQWWEEFVASDPFIVAELFVDPTARGRGVGRTLLEEICPPGPCWLATLAEAPARALYLHLGWEPLGEAVCGTGERLAFLAH